MNIESFKEDLEKHGELHVIVEEHEAIMAALAPSEDFIGLRKGNTKIVEEDEVIRVDDGKKEHCIDMERIVYYSAAQEFPD